MIFQLYSLRLRSVVVMISFFILFGFDVKAQDITLSNQNAVNSFFPGATYTGNITIGAPANGGPISNITNLTNFSELEVLKGNLTINLNTNLADLDKLSNLTEIDGMLLISNNNKLNNIDDFTSLEIISGVIQIKDNGTLTSINSFDKLNSILGILIQNNPLLQEVNGLKNLTKIEGSFSLSLNEILEDISGFSNLETVESLFVGFNGELGNLDALSNIILVETYFIIRNNSNLTDCCGIQNLLSDPFAIGSTIWIMNNPSECSSQQEVVDAYCGIKFNVVANPACPGESNGSFQINITDYKMTPFNYQWVRHEDGETGSGSSQSPYFSIDMLDIGTYDITITTSGQDTAIQFNVILPQESTESFFEITQIKTTNSSNENDNGSIELLVAESNPPYQILWSGPISGSQKDVMSDAMIIPWLANGEYVITVINNLGNVREITVSILDDEVPEIPCGKLDIVILNDVSGSVDNDEYLASKIFFTDLLAEINIGTGTDDSRASIIEWSSILQQEIKIPITGDIDILNTYLNAIRSFSDQNSMPEAMIFGGDYLDDVARPDAERVMIVATDASNGEIEQSIIDLANEYKDNGYHIVTIAFDNAFEAITIRNILAQMASIGSLTAGAPTYGDLDEDFVEHIVNIYLCPTGPGDDSIFNFHRDGLIDITNLNPLESCFNPNSVEVTFTIEALNQLPIPAGTDVTFYLNDPLQNDATSILTWQLLCSIPANSSETFTVTLPIDGESHIFAVLNDDGSQVASIDFPVTNIEEIDYSNNIDNESVCVGDFASIQATKYTTTPIPICDTIVNYIIDVCNISDEDAFGVMVTDQAPVGFSLLSSVYNLNGCATDNNGIFDIPAGCCLSVSLLYDASDAQAGNYDDQDVILSGSPDQEYLAYEGSTSTAEDVVLDGTIDCPSTLVEFSKEVNLLESCDDVVLTFTFNISNELNIPLHGLQFSDIVSFPGQWILGPYNISGLSIGTTSIDQNTAEFVIDEISANTIASFSLDLDIGVWPDDGMLINNATLENVPDLENGGIKTLTSNSTSTQIITPPDIIVPDTIRVNSSAENIDLSAQLNGTGIVTWTTNGDGIFSDTQSLSTSYTFGPVDQIAKEVLLFINAFNECYSIDDSITVIIEPCEIEFVNFEQSECNDNNTPNDRTDDFFTIDFELSAIYPSSDSIFQVVIDNDTIGDFTYFSEHSIPISADGEVHVIKFVDTQIEDCFIVEAVQVESCSDQCELNLVQLQVTDCDDNGTPNDNSDDIYSINFIIEGLNIGMDSTYYVVIDNDTIDGFKYGEDQLITLSANNNSGTIQFVDSQYEYCFQTINVGVENCIYPCSIFSDQLTVSECDDNGTFDDPSDDFYTVTYTISSTYPGIDSTYFAILNTDTIGEFSYDSEHSVTLVADGIDNFLSFVDTQFLDCILSDTVNVESCSHPCELNMIQLVVSECNDNGTPEDDTDDIYEINFNVFGINPGSDSTYFVIVENDTIGQFPYAMEQVIALSADGSEDIVQFIDSQMETCFITETVNVESCSNPCELFLDYFIISECDNNGTPNDSLDDVITISFNALASFSGLDSSYLVASGSDTIGLFSYGMDYTIVLSANGDPHNLNFMDSQFPNCNLIEIVEVDNCSEPCSLFLDFWEISECDDNGTNDDETDDSYWINFSISAASPGQDSVYFVDLEQNSYGPFQYGIEQTLMLNADGQPDIMNIIDSEFELCQITQVANMIHCSTPEIVLEDVVIPNIFSPNDDRINDQWQVSFYNGSSFISCNIYDRWGNLVHKNEGTNLNWDGTYNGSPLSSGVFVYKIIYQNRNNEIMTKLGDVTIVR